MRLKIVIDLDNTIINSHLMINDLYKIDTGIDLGIKDDLDWNFKPYVSDELLPTILKYFNDERQYEHVYPIEGAIESIKELANRHEVWVVSKHTSKLRRELTTKWIMETFEGKVNVFFTDSFDKSSFGGCDIIIDDKPECINSMSLLSTYQILFGNYRWNEDFDINSITFRKAKDWKKVLKIVKEADDYISDFYTKICNYYDTLV